jgi:hypothetical protein
MMTSLAGALLDMRDLFGCSFPLHGGRCGLQRG